MGASSFGFVEGSMLFKPSAKTERGARGEVLTQSGFGYGPAWRLVTLGYGAPSWSAVRWFCSKTTCLLTNHKSGAFFKGQRLNGMIGLSLNARKFCNIPLG